MGQPFCRVKVPSVGVPEVSVSQTPINDTSAIFLGTALHFLAVMYRCGHQTS